MNDKLLKAFRQGNITRYRLAKESGVDLSTVYRWQADRSAVGLNSITKIAKVLGFKIILEPLKGN